MCSIYSRYFPKLLFSENIFPSLELLFLNRPFALYAQGWILVETREWINVNSQSGERNVFWMAKDWEKETRGVVRTGGECGKKNETV